MRTEEELIKDFQYLLLIEMHKKRSVIGKMVYKSLGTFPEYANATETRNKCISDILRRVKEQFEDPGEYSNRQKFKALKLARFQESKNYVSEYLISAVKTYCRSKRNKCNVGRKVGDPSKGEKHKAVKQGKANRVDHGGLDDIFNKSPAAQKSLAHLSDEAILATIDYLTKIHLTDNEIQCFWDRLDGMTYKQMAEEYLESTSTKGHGESLYCKRFNRLKKKLIGKQQKLIAIMSQDFSA